MPSGCEVIEAHTLWLDGEAHRAIDAKKSAAPSLHRLRKHRRRVGQRGTMKLPKMLDN
jgi:hypothetical protein